MLTACSANPERLPGAAISAPDPSKIMESLRKVVAEAKLEKPHEISLPIKAHPISSAPWIICLRSGASELSKRRTYAVFYDASGYVSSRMSVIVDGCDGQVFTAFEK